MSFRTRFAPSPTGPLHLGHAYSAMLAHDMAMAEGGAFLLRIEDIDNTRSRPEWEDGIFEDLRWLGLSWEEPVMRQSERLPAYRDALQTLWHQNSLLYPCTCTRKDISAALSAPQEGDTAFGPDGPVYPGTCREVSSRLGKMPKGVALRLDMSSALSTTGESNFSFQEAGLNGPREVSFSAREVFQGIGDIVLSRKDFLGSYHLSVVIDDAAQEITHVVRGEDLFEATKIHVILQRILGLPTPIYHHHRLIRDEDGKRLAKRDDARAIRKYREDGATPADIRRMVGL